MHMSNIPTTDFLQKMRSIEPGASAPTAAAESEPSAIAEHGRKEQWDLESPPMDRDVRPQKTGPSRRFDWLHDMSKLAQGDTALLKSRRRNMERLREANERDMGDLSKYLPSDVNWFFPIGVEGPNDEASPSEDWIRRVQRVGETPCPVPVAPHFLFAIDEESVAANTAYLEKRGWDLMLALRDHEGTTAGHGSEFRPMDQMQSIVGGHPSFPFLKEMFEEGFKYHLSHQLSEEERNDEFEAQFDRGNHQSALADMDQVIKLLHNDVRHGFAVPIKASELHRVIGVHLQPGGIVSQFSINGDGTRKLKKRFTHDLSFSLTQDKVSINDRIDMDQYPDMVYGWCLLRILHYLSALRSRNPGTRIFISKYDYSDAYKRISQEARTAAATVIRVGDVAYICTRMVFGGAPNPAGFSGFSETLTDLSNELAMSNYEPSEHGTSPSVLPTHLVFREGASVEDSPVLPAIMPALEVPTTNKDSFRDCFIDDIVDCHLDTPRNRRRSPHLVQMAVHVMSRPHAGEGHEPIPRKPLLGPEKLEAEGRSSETQIVLGWEIKTRPFIVSLPVDKYLAWDHDLSEVIQRGGCSIQELESMVGRLTHASYLIPLSRHFLNEIRNKSQTKSRNKTRQVVRFTTDEIADLKLWRDYLQLARVGISINLLVTRTPTRMAWSDSCPYGLGGYTLSGWAWRVRVPVGLVFRGDDTVNNALEFLGMSVSVLLLLIESAEAGEEHPCLMVLGDNTSAISWMFKSGRIHRSSRYYHAVKMIARHTARSVMDAGAKLCSQHLAGESNTVADILSFEGDCRSKVEPLTADSPADDVLTQRIHLTHSQVIPSGFEIRPLPVEVASFVCSVLQTLARSWTPKEKQHTSEGTCTGDGGEDSSANGGVLVMTPSSITYPRTTKGSSWREDLSSVTGCSSSTARGDLLASVRSQWYHRLFATPLAAWHRRSGNVEGPAPSTSRAESMTQDRSTRGLDLC